MPAPTHWRLLDDLTIVFMLLPLLGSCITCPPLRLVFNGSQIRVVSNSDPGMLVGVTLSVRPVVETTFTVLLPAVLVDAAHPVEPVQTEAIATNHPLFPRWVKEFYPVTPLTGSVSL